MAEARRLCRRVAEITDPFTLEAWASSFLGRLWEQRDHADHDDGWAFFLGGPVAEDIAEVGGRGAKAALMALARLDPTVFGFMCRELAGQLADVALPHWFAQVGDITVSRAVTAGSIDETEDGDVIVLGARRRRAEMYSLAIGLEPGGMATCLITTWPFDVALERFGQQAEARGHPDAFREIEPAVACRRALQAMRQTDASPGADLHEFYGKVRALALVYLRSQAPPGAVRAGLPVAA